MSSLRKKNPSLVPVVKGGQVLKMNQASSGIAGVLDNLKGKLSRLEAGAEACWRPLAARPLLISSHRPCCTEIQADEKGKSEYDNELARLANRRAEIERRLDANETWATNFDSDIGPFEEK